MPNRVGAMQADLLSASNRVCLLPSNTTLASVFKRAKPSCTLSYCVRLTNAPIVVSSLRGLPARTAASFALAASDTASNKWAGTKARRGAVQRCPVLIVMSRTKLSTNKSKAAHPAVASCPKMVEFKLSASIFTRTESRAIAA